MFDKNIDEGLAYSIDLSNMVVPNRNNTVYSFSFKNFMKYFRFSGGFNFIDRDGLLRNVYIKNVIYNRPATVVNWSDGTKTVSKVHGEDEYNPEAGLILCILKKLQGSTHIRDLLHTWVPENAYTDSVVTISTSDARRREKSSK
jgi:hypothetical protein